MTIRDINDIINAVCPNDEDYEKPCISPKYLRQELEKLALEQEQYYLESNCSEIPTGSTTKNNLPRCQCTDAEIAKSFIEDVEAVKDKLPCGEQMDFPNTFDEFAEDYGFKDKDKVYTNGIELIPVYRVKQWLEHISTTKNDLGVDAVSRDEVCRYVAEFVNHEFSTREEEELIDNIITGIERMPSVTPQEPQIFKWCDTCREYDQEKHCCHRWSKVIRDTVKEIKQEYIEREALDKLRAELHETAEMHEDGDYYIRDEWIDEYFDKYKAETEK